MRPPWRWPGEQRHRHRRPGLGRHLRDAARLRRPGRAAGRALRCSQPRRRGHDARRRRDGLLGGAADRRAGRSRTGPRCRRGCRGRRRRGTNPRLSRHHPAGEPDRLGPGADDLRGRCRAFVLSRERSQPRRFAGAARVSRRERVRPARSADPRPDRLRADVARLRLLGLRRARCPVPGEDAARVERARCRRVAGRRGRDGHQRRSLPVCAHARRRCLRRRGRRLLQHLHPQPVGRRPHQRSGLDRDCARDLLVLAPASLPRRGVPVRGVPGPAADAAGARGDGAAHRGV